MSEETTHCLDCGLQAWRFREDGCRFVHEDFYVTDSLWRRVCPEKGVLCIGCFERRLGGRLYREDFTGAPRVSTAPWPGCGVPPSRRFVDRWATERYAQLELEVPA